jgi:hypothetical protein
MDEVEQALALSTIAVESIYGEPAMMVDGKFSVNKRARTCQIDAETQLGCDLAKVFAGFMNTKSGGCFRTETVECKEQLGDMLDLFRAFV